MSYMADQGGGRDTEVGGDGSRAGLWLSTAQVWTETERWDDQCLVQMSWLLRVYNENHLLLDFPFAKQEGEQVTQKKNTKKNKKQKQKERKTKN